jgi:hypothetical protein
MLGHDSYHPSTFHFDPLFPNAEGSLSLRTRLLHLTDLIDRLKYLHLQKWTLLSGSAVTSKTYALRKVCGTRLWLHMLDPKFEVYIAGLCFMSPRDYLCDEQLVHQNATCML